MIEDLAAFMDARQPSSAASPDAALLAQVLEHTVIEERAYLSGPERVVVERFYPQINNWLLGYDLDNAVASLEQGLADLRAGCRARE